MPSRTGRVCKPGPASSEFGDIHGPLSGHLASLGDHSSNNTLAFRSLEQGSQPAVLSLRRHINRVQLSSKQPHHTSAATRHTPTQQDPTSPSTCATAHKSAPAMSEKKAANGHHDGSSSRAFTEEQKAAVIRVRKCSPTAFYDILGLESVRSSCSDSDIKKAYRKLSLLTHPDKNGYKGADEAFKMVSRAFQVLSDEDKKKKFDRFGGDPESRFGGGGGGGAASGASPFSGFAQQRGGRGPMFEEEISPEELFRQFFGGGLGGGGPFGGGPFGES